MTQEKKKRKRFQVHNYGKVCGNCGLYLYEDDAIIKVSGWSPVDEGYYHEDFNGCVQAADLLKSKLGLTKRKGVPYYG